MSTSWADFAEEEDGEVDLQVELPARTETAPDAKGIKKVLFCSLSLFFFLTGVALKPPVPHPSSTRTYFPSPVFVVVDVPRLCSTNAETTGVSSR